MSKKETKWLYLYSDFRARVPEAEIGSGKTVTFKLSDFSPGDPAAIAAGVEGSVTASGGEYARTFTRAALRAALEAERIGRLIYLHADDGAGWHDVQPLRVTIIDPDLLGLPK
jgi:hypothetical protein